MPLTCSCWKKKKKKKKKSGRPKLALLLLLVALLLLLLLLAVAASSWFAIIRIGSGYNFPTTLEYDVSEGSGFLLKANQTQHTVTHYGHNASSSVEPAPSRSNFSDADASQQTGRTSASTATAPPANIGVELEVESGPYHNWQLFVADFQDMMRNFRIFVYPDVSGNITPFARVFLPHPNPFHPRLGNYFSEHMFKLALLGSSLVTPIPEEAHFFFLPFSINNLRNDPRVHSEGSISEFVAQYTGTVSRQFPFWNASGGADHFYVCCHSIGREAASKHHELHNNAIQVTCSSSYFQRFYFSHKDVGLPQVWPRPHQNALNPPHARHKLVYFAGRIQNSHIRQELIALWGNDTYMDIFHNYPPFPYEEGFKRSKYCLHVKGYEVNTARISDAIHYGCIPVMLSNYYDLPFADVLDWSKFSIVINHGEIVFLKKRLLSITRQTYLSMYNNLCQVRRHFVWHRMPRGYDSFHMTAYQLWLRRSIHRLPY